MAKKNKKRRRVSHWRKLLAALISVAILIAPYGSVVRLEVRSQDETAVIIKK